MIWDYFCGVAQADKFAWINSLANPWEFSWRISLILWYCGAYDFPIFAFSRDLKWAATDLAICREALGRDAGIHGHIEGLAAERALDGREFFHQTIVGGCGQSANWRWGILIQGVAGRGCPSGWNKVGGGSSMMPMRLKKAEWINIWRSPLARRGWFLLRRCRLKPSVFQGSLNWLQGCYRAITSMRYRAGSGTEVF